MRLTCPRMYPCISIGIALSSGFASVYTEKVIKAQRSKSVTRQTYSLAYLQVQLATASMIIIGLRTRRKPPRAGPQVVACGARAGLEGHHVLAERVRVRAMTRVRPVSVKTSVSASSIASWRRATASMMGIVILASMTESLSMCDRCT